MNNITPIKAFALGFVFALGEIAARREQLAFDSTFIEEEHPRDQKGQFSKVQNKYDTQANSKQILAIKAKYPDAQPNEKQKSARIKYQSQLDDAIKEQTPKTQNLIKQVKLNPNGLTKMPPIPHSVLKKLGLKNTKPVYLPLESQLRILSRHPELSAENLRSGLALSLYGNGERHYDRERRETYLHFTYDIKGHTKNDIVLEIREKAEAFEVVHFIKLVRRSS